MKEITFGLDIGATSVKTVWLERQKEGISLKACMSVPSPAKGIFSESPFDQEQMAQVISDLISEAKVPSRLVNLALSDGQVFTKVIDMPVLSDKELSSAVYWEAEQYIPAPLSTITIDWMVLRRDVKMQSGLKMQVLLVAAPTELLKRYQKIVELAGFSVASVETEILAVVRSVLTGSTFPTSIVMNIGSLNTALAIVQNGMVIFTYSIPLGGIAINRAIASDFNFTNLQAEEYKKTYGILEKNFGGKIGKAVDPILTSLVSEVRKALAFYNEKYKNISPVTQVQLAGGTAKLPGLNLYFAKNLSIETVIANPWKALNIQGVPPPLLEAGPEYAVATGLALKDI
ncbi:MAG: type IV pilus assembly protein PilM [Candidatus Levybacteria bacterium]|nr:type IV pilus assembly protein PilM [Candidatus Levybacteria bacterium]